MKIVDEWLFVIGDCKVKWWYFVFYNVIVMVGVGVLGLFNVMVYLIW